MPGSATAGGIVVSVVALVIRLPAVATLPGAWLSAELHSPRMARVLWAAKGENG